VLQRVSTFKPLKNVKQITLLKKYSQNRHKKSMFYRKTIKCRSPTSSGTGPGLPGLPLAIINPTKQFVLLDSLGKRISFIRNAVRELGLTNVEPVLSRVEEYQPEQKFDGVLSRAFASLKDMTDWCHHLPKKDGYFYALKGIYHEDEVQELDKKFEVKDVITLHVPELVGERHLIVLR
jgi:16S rRNA (guanine527-N7)-methyltransferase